MNPSINWPWCRKVSKQDKTPGILNRPGDAGTAHPDAVMIRHQDVRFYLKKGANLQKTWEKLSRMNKTANMKSACMSFGTGAAGLFKILYTAAFGSGNMFPYPDTKTLIAIYGAEFHPAGSAGLPA
jgi:hypothetical protein